jgi:hypothetical protein
MYYNSPCPNQEKCRVANSHSYVRALHASPDAPAVDIYVNDNLVARGLRYRDFTPYVPLAGGLYNIKVFQTGTITNPVIDKNVNIPPSSIFTLAATGMLRDIGLTLIPEPPVKREPYDTFLRFIQLSPDSPNVDLYLANGTRLFENVEYKEITDYIPFRPGIYEFRVRLTGTQEVILTVPNANLRQGNVYSIYMIGLKNGDPSLQVLIPLDGSTYLHR